MQFPRVEGVDVANIRERLLDVERRWLAGEAARRRLSNERIRTVNDAVDEGLSQGEVARVMSGAGRQIRRSDVSKILACGYPQDDASAAS